MISQTSLLVLRLEPLSSCLLSQPSNYYTADDFYCLVSQKLDLNCTDNVPKLH